MGTIVFWRRMLLVDRVLCNLAKAWVNSLVLVGNFELNPYRSRTNLGVHNFSFMPWKKSFLKNTEKQKIQRLFMVATLKENCRGKCLIPHSHQLN